MTLKLESLMIINNFKLFQAPRLGMDLSFDKINIVPWDYSDQIGLKLWSIGKVLR